MKKLHEKVVYLTGATKGIGREIALLLAKQNARLALCGRNTDDLNRVAALIINSGSQKPFTGTFDLSDEKEILGLYRDAKKFHGPPDILINNAGYNSRKAPVRDISTEEFDSIFSVNLRAPFILMREAVKDMTLRMSGQIVTILSSVCHYSMENMGAYTAAKKGLEGLIDVFRKEVLGYNIRVTSIYPGGTDTSFRKASRSQYMRPESVAEAVLAALTLPEDLVVHQFTFRPMVESNF